MTLNTVLVIGIFAAVAYLVYSQYKEQKKDYNERKGPGGSSSDTDFE